VGTNNSVLDNLAQRLVFW